MNELSIDEVREIKMLIQKTKALEKTVHDILYKGDNDNQYSQYSSFKEMARMYNDLAEQSRKVMKVGAFYLLNIDEMKHWANSLPMEMKSILDIVLVNTRFLTTTLESNIDFIVEEIDNIENFIKTKLRSTVFEEPTKEKQIQNNIELLFLGKGFSKGIDYDRETGKFNFSGREYIPDFVLPKLRLCIEVKLLKNNSSKSKVIEEINADITAYKKIYENVLFVVYDIGKIRDEVEFRRDIENNEGVKIVIVKH